MIYIFVVSTITIILLIVEEQRLRNIQMLLWQDETVWRVLSMTYRRDNVEKNNKV